MDSKIERKLGSTIYQRLDGVRMSEFDRETAISAMSNAELLVDAFVWFAKKIERAGDRLFLKPSLKH